MAGHDIVKIILSFLVAGIVIYNLSSVNDLLAHAEIRFIAALSMMVLMFGFFSIYKKIKS